MSESEIDVGNFTKGRPLFQLRSLSHLRLQRDHGEQAQEPDQLLQLQRLILLGGRQGMDSSVNFKSELNSDFFFSTRSFFIRDNVAS